MKPHSKLMQEMYADSSPHPSPWLWDQCTVVKHSLMISYQTSTAYPCNLTDISKMSGRGNSHGIQHFCRRMKAAVLIYCLCCFFRTCNIFIFINLREESHQDSNASVRYCTVTCKEHCTIGLASYSTQVPQSAFVLDHY